MSNLKLTIDLLPKGAWGNNLSRTLPKKDWDVIRKLCYQRAGYRCEICGYETEDLDAHEVWDFHIPTRTQTLKNIEALCSRCHGVKHMRNSERMGYGENAKRHFFAVNKCNEMAYAKHRADAQFLFDARNEVLRWNLKADLTKYGLKGVVPKKRIIPLIKNPYESVDWETVNHIKAALHTHTKNSLRYDRGAGNATPEQMMDAYGNAGFGALIVADHDYVTNVNGAGLITVLGNELSRSPEHILYYGTKYEDTQNVGFEQNLKGIAISGGIAYLAHPSRTAGTKFERDDNWWLDKILRNPCVKGIEVFNTRNFSRDHSEEFWDAMLCETMPNRPVYGIATDDNHSDLKLSHESDLGAGYTTVLLSDSDMNSQGLFDALINGNMLFSTHRIIVCQNGSSDDDKPRPYVTPPKVRSIEVDNYQGTITVTADYAKKIQWIMDGEIIKTDYKTAGKLTAEFKVENLEGKYVRFRLIGDGGQTCSQPFGLYREAI